LPQSTVPAGLWQGLSPRLAGGERGVGERRTALDRSFHGPRAAPRMPFRTGLLAMAASLLFLIGLGLWRSEPVEYSQQHDAQHDAEFTAVIGHYVEALAEDPEQAEHFLMQRYPGRTVDPSEAVELIGYRPAFAEGLPRGYSRASTRLMQMPCCTCLKPSADAVTARHSSSSNVVRQPTLPPPAERRRPSASKKAVV